MAKKDNIITIDLNQYTTQVQWAEENGENVNTVFQWVKRKKDGKGKAPIEILEIPELGITLIKRRD